MSGIVPASRPQMTRAFAEAFVRGQGVHDVVVVFGRRGYFRDTMGARGANDRNAYDDAIALLAPGRFLTFNANTDPSRQEGTTPGLATLEPGVWIYRVGTHGMSHPPEQRYTALVEAEPVVVRRDGTAHYAGGVDHPSYGHCLGGGLWRGMFGINIHRGGVTTTSSLGCQTIHPGQWGEFITAVHDELRQAGQARVAYVLTDRGSAPQ